MRAVQQAWHERPRLQEASLVPTAASGLWAGADDPTPTPAPATATAPPRSAAGGAPPDELARCGFVAVEEEEGVQHLCCYGEPGPGEALGRAEAAALENATAASFHFVRFDRLVLHQLPRLRQMPHLCHLALCHNDLHSLSQLGALASLPKLTSLQVSVDGNTVVLVRVRNPRPPSPRSQAQPQPQTQTPPQP
jgi:hypothetical protein